METTLDFADRLRLIDERMGTVAAVFAAAPDLGERVPTCPEWTLYDLAQHLGDSRRRWAATVIAGDPGAGAPAGFAPQVAPREPAELGAWLVAAARELVTALREAGPDSPCWTWWPDSQSPQTAGAVARHQLMEVAVHTYDAQLTGGAAQPLPEDVARDGVADFLETCVATTAAWPHEPAVIDYHVRGDRSWRVHLDAGGARVGVPDDGPASVSARGTAGEFVLWFYGRVPLDGFDVTGDVRVVDRIIAWDPSA